MIVIITCVLLCGTFTEVNGLIWTQHEARTEAQGVLYACVGSDVAFPFNYMLEGHEVISSIQWFYRSGSTETSVAYVANNLLSVNALYSGRFRHSANSSTGLNHVTVEDSGNYTVQINIRGGAAAFYKRTVVLQVADGLLTSDGKLHADQKVDVVQGNEALHWSVELTCGQFVYFGLPAFPMEWVTPSGEVVPSTDYVQGNFILRLSSQKLEDGPYSCRVPTQHLPDACLPGNRTDQGQVKVAVSKVDIKLTLMQAEMRSLRHAVEETVPPTVAFNAAAVTDQQLTSPERLQFHRAFYNMGNGYNNETGEFTAPVSGTYLFALQARSLGEELADAALTWSGHAACVAYLSRGSPHGSCQAVLHVQAGQRVWVEPRRAGSYEAGATSFSGFLMRHEPLL